MANIISYVDVIECLRSISERHHQLNTFFLGKNWNLGEGETITYPCLQVYPEASAFPVNDYGDYKTIEIKVNCKVIDMVRMNKENELDVDSDTLRIAQDIINEFNQHPFYQRSNANLVGDIELTNLSEYNSDGTSGWEFSIRLKLVNNNTFCGLPMEDITGFSAAGPVYTGYSTSVQYLSCDTVTGCTTLTNYIQNLIDSSTSPPFTGGTVTGSTIFTGGLSTSNVSNTQVAFGSGSTIVSSTGLTYANDVLRLQGTAGVVNQIISNNNTNGGYAEIMLTTDISDTRFGAGGTNTTPYGGNAGDSYFGNVSSHGLILATSNTVRAYFKGTGELGLGTGFLTPQRQFHQSGGKFLVESTDGSYGQFQIVNPQDSEVTLVLGSNATVNAGGTLSGTASKIWAFGLGSYGYTSDNFIIGNNSLNGPALRINYDGKTYLTEALYSKDIVLENSKNIKSSTGGGNINLDNSEVFISTDSGTYSAQQLYLSNGYVELSDYSVGGTVGIYGNYFQAIAGNGFAIAPSGNDSYVFINDSNQTTGNIYVGIGDHIDTIKMSAVQGVANGTANTQKPGTIISSRVSYFDAGIQNSVILGGTGLHGTSSESVFVPYLNIKYLTGSTAVNNLGIDANGFVCAGGSSGGLGIVTGGTYSNGTATFNNNTGGTFSVTGFYTGFTGGTVTGPTNFTAGLTANTLSLSGGDVQAQINLKLNIEAAAISASSGITLTFLIDTVYGTISSACTGNISFSSTGAKVGVTNIVIHNDSVAPTFSANMKKLSSSTNYLTNVVNYIYVTYINSTEVIYLINQRT